MTAPDMKERPGIAGIATVAITLAAQVFAGAWWASAQAEKMNNIERRLAAADQQNLAEAEAKIVQADRLARIEVSLAALAKTMGEINARLYRRSQDRN